MWAISLYLAGRVHNLLVGIGLSSVLHAFRQNEAKGYGWAHATDHSYYPVCTQVLLIHGFRVLVPMDRHPSPHAHAFDRVRISAKVQLLTV